MTQRLPKERKITISLPFEVCEWIDRRAARQFTSTAQALRSLVVDAYWAGDTPQPTESSSTSAGSRALPATRSGFKGVHTYGKRWAAVAYVSGKRQRLGIYDTPEEAAKAYDQHLIARSGDPRAAVNFPHDLDQLSAASAPFVERLATAGQLNDIDWQTYQEATRNHVGPATGPMPVMPPSAAKVDASTPLIDRPAKSLLRRDPPAPTPIRPDPVPAEPDEGPPDPDHVH